VRPGHIRAVFLDVGETLVDETRVWEGWADWLGVPRFTFFAALGGVIERREHHLAVFDLFRSGFDLAAERAAKNEAGVLWAVEERDLYPDVRPALKRLRADGYLVGISGNQPEGMTQALRALNLPVDLIENSADWGVEKPDPEFFVRVAAVAGLPPGRIAYVGDRLDNDVLPARAAGMASVFLRRGPWGLAHDRWPEVQLAAARIDELTQLPDVLAALDRAAGATEST
jgi:HAD superfamily hydrolase (TIGR01549 family)